MHIRFDYDIIFLLILKNSNVMIPIFEFATCI